MQQNLGTWWQVSYNNWMPINRNALDNNSLNSYLYQKSLKTSPALKDSVIGNSELSALNYIQKDQIKKGFELKSSSIGIFKDTKDIADKLYNWWVERTQKGDLSKVFDIGGFYRDKDGIYHAKQNGSVQSWKYSGYNDLYDNVFDVFCDMDKAKFPFEYEGQDLIFWAWKGDYLNYGAGTEMAIYEKMKIFGFETEHWIINKSYSLPMSLKLEDKEGNSIIDYDPKTTESNPNKWWVTGFNPHFQNNVASNLKATYTVDFSGKEGMYDAFSDAYEDIDSRWEFNPVEHKAIFTFE